MNRMEEEVCVGQCQINWTEWRSYQFKSLRACCNTTSFSVTVPSTAGATFGPVYYADEVSERFIEIVYGISWVDFVLKFQGFAMAGIKGKSLYHQLTKSTDTHIDIRSGKEP